MKIFNQKFFLVMSFFIICTFFLYKYKVLNFINNSEECVVVLDKNEINEKKINEIVKNLEKMTFQDVQYDDNGNELSIIIKCPQEKKGFFVDWIKKSIKGE